MNPSPIITDPVQLQQQQKESRTLLNQHEVNKFLTQCGLSQYYSLFIEEGFDRPESLLEVTETDLIQMEVKRGHRRLLQRAIANAKGIPCTVPLNITPIPKPAMTEYNNREEPNKKVLQPQEAMNVSLQLLAGSNNSPLSSSATNTSSNSSSSSTLNTISPNNTSTPTNNNNNNNNNISTLASSVNNNNSSNNNDYFPSAGTMTHSAQSGMSSTEEEAVTSDNVHRLWKRKYHRHAKPDTNAPLKPPSAYVMFSNDVRAELKQQNKSFTDLAKIIGDRWKNISAEEKELYETNAMKSREEYLKKIEEYHKTDEYKKYQQYISDFKAENEAASRPVGRPRKRHRRDDYASDGAMSDSKKRASSISSQTEELQQQQQQQLQQQQRQQQQQLQQQQQQLQQQQLQQQQHQQQHQRTNSISSEQRHYPFYLLNEDSAMSEK